VDYADTPEQAALREAVRAFLSRTHGEDMWKRLTAELGLTGLAVPSRYGGASAGLAEVAVAVEEAGRVLLPLPLLSTALAGFVLGEAPDTPAELLSGIADGSQAASFVTNDLIGVTDGHLFGVASHVLDGGAADLFLVRTERGLFAVRAADTVVSPAETLDQTRTQATVVFDGSAAVPVGADAARAEELLRVMLAVESAGAAAHCLETTVAYLKTRVQFGRPIGTFQALKHRCADLAVAVASARAVARAAVCAAAGGPGQSSAAAGGPGQSSTATDADPQRLAVLAPLAKKHCADVFWQAAAEMVQLHGGIGFTWEHEAHRYLKRAKTTQLLHGSPAELRRLVAQRAGLI
jgi:alkylation response protein AidB-like acyl-CoA dehydrogenase